MKRQLLSAFLVILGCTTTVHAQLFTVCNMAGKKAWYFSGASANLHAATVENAFQAYVLEKYGDTPREHQTATCGYARPEIEVIEYVNMNVRQFDKPEYPVIATGWNGRGAPHAAGPPAPAIVVTTRSPQEMQAERDALAGQQARAAIEQRKTELRRQYEAEKVRVDQRNRQRLGELRKNWQKRNAECRSHYSWEGITLVLSKNAPAHCRSIPHSARAKQQ